MSTNQLQTEISHWDLYRHFSAWSSVNGLPHIILTNSACLRLIWTSITFFAFFAGLYQTGSLINDYYSYPVNLKTNTSYGTLAFPSVSLCNANAWKVSQASGTPLRQLPSICANSKELRRHWGGSQSACHSWIGQNTALVEIFHQRLTTITVVESQAYQVIDFIADAGGALGLWLGMSAISALEVLILLVMAIAYCYARPARRAKIRPGYDYFAHFVQKPKNKNKFALATPPVRKMSVANAAAMVANTNKWHK